METEEVEMADVVVIEDNNDEKDMEVDCSEENLDEKHEEDTCKNEKGSSKVEGTPPGESDAKVDKPKMRRKLTESEKALRVKTKELKEKQRLEEKERKEKEKMEIKLKKEKEKDEKKRQKEEEKKQKEEEKKQKEEEKRIKAEQLEEEKRKKEEHKLLEKKKKELEAEQKNIKEKMMMKNFFKKSTETPPKTTTNKTTSGLFQAFEVKPNMKLAPLLRVVPPILHNKILSLDQSFQKSDYKGQLYLKELKEGHVKVGSWAKTWPNKDDDDDDDVITLRDEDDEDEDEPKKITKMVKMKLLSFHENNRPAYYGTWSKRSVVVGGRKPFHKDPVLDYEVDSDDEWEEEEPGESISHSEGDEEEDGEKEDDDEEEDGFFVPHGYLSEDEGGDDNDDISPETLKARQMIKMKNFEEEMKTNKIKKLKPLCVGLYWGPGGRFEDGEEEVGGGEEPKEIKLNGDNNGKKEDEGEGNTKVEGDSVKAEVEGGNGEVDGGGVVKKHFRRLPFTDNQIHQMSNFFHEFQAQVFDKGTMLPLDIKPYMPLDEATTFKAIDSTSSRKGKLLPVPDEALPMLVTLVHGCGHSIDKISHEFRHFWASHKKEGQEGISKRQLEAKVREIAEYKRVVEKHPHRFWYVKEDVLLLHNLQHLPVPSTWKWKTFSKTSRKSLNKQINDSCNDDVMKTPQITAPSNDHTTPKHTHHPSIMKFISQSGSAVSSLESAKKQQLRIDKLPSVNFDDPSHITSQTIIDDDDVMFCGVEDNKENKTNGRGKADDNNEMKNMRNDETSVLKGDSKESYIKAPLKRPSDSENEHDSKKPKLDVEKKPRRIQTQQITSLNPPTNEISKTLTGSSPSVRRIIPHTITTSHVNSPSNLNPFPQNVTNSPSSRPTTNHFVSPNKQIFTPTKYINTTPGKHEISTPNKNEISTPNKQILTPNKKATTPSNRTSNNDSPASFKKPRRVTTLLVSPPSVDKVLNGSEAVVNGGSKMLNGVDVEVDDSRKDVNGGDTKVNGADMIVNGDDNGELMEGVTHIESSEHTTDGDRGSSGSSSDGDRGSSGSSSNSDVRSSLSSSEEMNQTVINVYELNGKKEEHIDLEKNENKDGDVKFERVDAGMGGKVNESSKKAFMKAFKSCSDVVVINDDSEEKEKVAHTPLKNNPITNFFKVLPPKNNS